MTDSKKFEPAPQWGLRDQVIDWLFWFVDRLDEVEPPTKDEHEIPPLQK